MKGQLKGQLERNRILSQGLPAPAPLRGLPLPVANSNEDRRQNSGDASEEDRVFGKNPSSTAGHRCDIGQETNPSLPACRQSPTPAIRLRIKPSGLSGKWHAGHQVILQGIHASSLWR